MTPKLLYALYRRDRGKGTRWERMSAGAYPKPVAVRVFQNALITGAFCPDFEYRLRVAPAPKEA